MDEGKGNENKSDISRPYKGGKVGGARPGAGRPAGVPNKNMRDVRDIIDKIVDFDKVFASLFQLATGKRPDTFASRLLLEYRYGKPFQAYGIVTPKDQIPRIAIIQQGNEISLIIDKPVENKTIDVSHTDEPTNLNTDGRNDEQPASVPTPE